MSKRDPAHTPRLVYVLVGFTAGVLLFYLSKNWLSDLIRDAFDAITGNWL